MRVRKIAKQLKLFHKNVKFDNEGYPVCKYKVANHSAKTNYIMRMTRKHYFGLRNKYQVIVLLLGIANTIFQETEFLVKKIIISQNCFR